MFSQPKLYRSVIEDVINEVRELFLDEGVDEQVLMELKTVQNTELFLLVTFHSRMLFSLVCASVGFPFVAPI
jgi:hypothetical protein